MDANERRWAHGQGRRASLILAACVVVMGACGVEGADDRAETAVQEAPDEPTAEELASADLVGEWRLAITFGEIVREDGVEEPLREPVERTYRFFCAAEEEPCDLQLEREGGDGVRPPVQVTREGSVWGATDTFEDREICPEQDGLPAVTGTVTLDLTFRVLEAEPDGGDGWRATRFTGDVHERHESSSPDCPSFDVPSTFEGVRV